MSIAVRHPKEARSIILGGTFVRRCVGLRASLAVEEPVEPATELCQSTALEMRKGQKVIGAPLEALEVAASVAMTPITRSAIGFRL